MTDAEHVPVRGRTRWRPFAIVLGAGLALSVTMLTGVANGAIPASFAVSGSTFKVSADKLVGNGFVQYGGMVQKKDKTQREAVMFIKQKIDSAKWFIDAIKQRENTMLKTVKTIVYMQEEFFKTGDIRKLKPMVLKDVAQKTGMNISTESAMAEMMVTENWR